MAPTAFLIPIWWVRSLIVTNIIFATPKVPTIKDKIAMAHPPIFTLSKKELSNENIDKVLDLFTSGNYPHHKPIRHFVLTSLGLKVKNTIPYEINELFNSYLFL